MVKNFSVLTRKKIKNLSVSFTKKEMVKLEVTYEKSNKTKEYWFDLKNKRDVKKLKKLITFAHKNLKKHPTAKKLRDFSDIRFHEISEFSITTVTPVLFVSIPSKQAKKRAIRGSMLFHLGNASNIAELKYLLKKLKKRL